MGGGEGATNFQFLSDNEGLQGAYDFSLQIRPDFPRRTGIKSRMLP